MASQCSSTELANFEVEPPKRRRWSIISALTRPFRASADRSRRAYSDPGGYQDELAMPFAPASPLLRVRSRKTMNPLYRKSVKHAPAVPAVDADEGDSPMSSPEQGVARRSRGGKSFRYGKSTKRGKSVKHQGEKPPKPPPRPSLKYKNNKRPAVQVAQSLPDEDQMLLMEVAGLPSTQELGTAGTNMSSEDRRARNHRKKTKGKGDGINRQRPTTGRWTAKDAVQHDVDATPTTPTTPTTPAPTEVAGVPKQHGEKKQRAKSIKLANRPLPIAPAVSPLTDQAESTPPASPAMGGQRRSTKHRPRGLSVKLPGAAKPQSMKRIQQRQSQRNQQQSNSDQGASRGQSTKHRSSSTRNQAQPTKPTKHKTRSRALEHRNISSTSTDGADFLLEREQEVAQRLADNKRRRSKRTEPELGGNGQALTSPVKVNKINRKGTGKFVPRKGKDAAAAPLITAQEPAKPAKSLRRKGTGKFVDRNGERAARSQAGPAEAQQDARAAKGPKRQGTGKWDQRGGRRSAASRAREPITATHELIDNELGNDVLDVSVYLAEAAWSELAAYQELGPNDVAHDSQINVEEGAESHIPSWRIEQINEKLKEELGGLTRYQRQRYIQNLRDRQSKQRQIDKLICNIHDQGDAGC